MDLYRVEKRVDELRSICLEELAIHQPTRQIARFEIVPLPAEEGQNWDVAEFQDFDGQPPPESVVLFARTVLDHQRDIFRLV